MGILFYFFLVQNDFKSESRFGKTGCGTVRENSGQCTFCSPITTLCRFQRGVAEVCTIASAVCFFLNFKTNHYISPMKSINQSINTSVQYKYIRNITIVVAHKTSVCLRVQVFYL